MMLLALEGASLPIGRGMSKGGDYALYGADVSSAVRSKVGHLASDGWMQP